jgi:putative membrane protein
MSRKALAMLEVTVFVFWLCASFGYAAEPGSRGDKISNDDAEFVKAAASGGMMEVQLGKMAAEKASNAKVKEFGRRMQQDHSKANDELKKIAARKDIKLPAALEGKHKSAVDKLSKLKGDEFDREYMSVMVDDHKEDIDKFQQQADKAKDAEIKKFAKDQLPILKKHLELAEQTRKQVSEGKK